MLYADVKTPKANVKKNQQWRKEYLRILINGPASSDDYPLAAELLDEEFARGRYLLNPNAPSGIVNLRWAGITTKGRIFADELQDKIRRSTWRYRARLALGSATSWLIGFLSHAYIQGFFG